MKGKKILFLIDDPTWGGVERAMLGLAEDWSRQGAEVVVVDLTAGDGRRRPLPAGVRRFGLNLSAVRRPLFLMPLRGISALLAVRRMLRTEKPNIVIGMRTLSCVILSLMRGGKHVIAVGRCARHHPPWVPYGKFGEEVRRRLYGRFDALVAETTEGGRRENINMPLQRVAAIPNPVSLPLPEHAPRLAVADVVAPGRKMLLAVGRLEEQKAFDRLLNAFASAVSWHGDWDLVILGEGELRGALEAQVARLGLGRRVFLPGFAGNMAEWYNAANAFALTSHYEGASGVLLEAMAHGCPAISVNCDAGPKDIIRDGVDGLLIPQDDSAALAEGLDRLLGDAALREHLASHAPEVLERFSPERIRGMWEELFDELKTAQGR